MAKTERFEKVYGQGVFTGNEIWVDTETGVQYLYHAAGYSGGLTVLVDARAHCPAVPQDTERTGVLTEKGAWLCCNSCSLAHGYAC